MRYFFVLCALACLPVSPAVSSDTYGTIEEIKVVGNKRVDYGTVVFYTKIAPFEEVTQSKVDSAIKNLYSTSLFSEIKIEVVGKELVIDVKENPIVRNVKIRGNKAFSDKNLSAVLKLKKMHVFTEDKLERDLSSLHALYQSRGFLGAKAHYEVKQREDASVDVLLNIVEGQVTKIEKVRFVGNSAFSGNDLKRVLASKERNLLDVMTLFGDSAKFFPERLMIDKSLLRDFYTSRGFLDFKVRSVVAEVTPDLSRAVLFFSLEEGKKYKFGESTVVIDSAVRPYEGAEEDLSEFVLSLKGKTFNMLAVSNSAAKITAHLNERGNLFASVESDYVVHGDTVDVKYRISLGKSVYINRIDILGNTRTLDPVIRRNLNISEGDVYSPVAIRKSRKRLVDLGFFELVEIETQKVSDSLVNLGFKVKEHGTGSIDVGGGFSSASGLVGKLSIKEYNVFGTGKLLAFDLSRSASSFSGMLDFVTPNLLDSDVSFGVGTFYSKQGVGVSSHNSGLLFPDNAFSNTNAGFSARFSCSLTETVAASLQYNNKYHSIHNISSSSADLIREEEGDHFDSSVGYSLIYSTLNSTYKPSSGIFARVDQSFSGVGGSLHYVKTEITGARFFSVLESLHSDIILKVKPSFGYVFAYAGEKVRIGQRFFIGSNEIRGFAASGIGPRDANTKEALGGKLYYGLITQLDFPLGLPENLGIKGSVFLDIASLSQLDHSKQTHGYDTSTVPRLSIGFGFSWRSPFGPIRVDLGFPIVKAGFDVQEGLRISTDAGI